MSNSEWKFKEGSYGQKLSNIFHTELIVIGICWFTWKSQILKGASSSWTLGNVFLCKQVTDLAEDKYLGRMYKRWSGCGREAFTDADTFGVTCKENILLSVFSYQVKNFINDIWHVTSTVSMFKKFSK